MLLSDAKALWPASPGEVACGGAGAASSRGAESSWLRQREAVARGTHRHCRLGRWSAQLLPRANIRGERERRHTHHDCIIVPQPGSGSHPSPCRGRCGQFNHGSPVVVLYL